MQYIQNFQPCWFNIITNNCRNKNKYELLVNGKTLYSLACTQHSERPSKKTIMFKTTHKRTKYSFWDSKIHEVHLFFRHLQTILILTLKYHL